MSEQNKEPESYTSWADKLLTELGLRRKARQDAAVKRAMSTDETILELREKAARGIRVRNFLDSDFWKLDLEPLVRAESVLKPWTPKDGEPAPDERCYNEFLMGSGKVAVVSRIITQFDRWEREGEQAQRVLDSEADRLQNLRRERGLANAE